jgi:hypothetical protein
MRRQDRKESKPGKQEGHTDPHKDCAQKQECKWSGDTRVSGEVEIKVPPDLLTEYRTGQKENTTHNDKSRLINWLTLLAVVIYAGLTAWQGCETRQLVRTGQDTYDAIDRPYIGVDGVSVTLFKPNPRGGITKIIDPGEDKLAIRMDISIAVKNYGSVPALNASSFMDVRLDGVAIPVDTSLRSDQGTEFFPGGVHSLPGIITGETYLDIASGKSILQLNVKFTYKYGGKTYSYCERHQYSPGALLFVNLGDVCDQPWAKKSP